MRHQRFAGTTIKTEHEDNNPLPEAAQLLWHWVRQEPLYALLCLDLNGRVTWVSAGVRKVLGYEPEDLLGQLVSVLFTQRDRERSLDHHELVVAQSAGYSENDRWHVRKDGSTVWIGGTLTAVRVEGKHVGYVKVMRDRTDVAAQLRSLESRAAHLQAADNEKSRFFASLVHELANPMAPIRTALDLFARVAEPERALLLRTVSRQMDVMQRVLEDLRGLVEAEQPSEKYDFRPVLLNELIAMVVAAAKPQADQKGLRLEVLLPASDIEVLGDASRIHQIVHNLVRNAIKYTDFGGRIWVKLTAEGESAVVRVEDTGVGIEPEMLPRIFDLFTQETRSRDRAEGGWGVGLAVVKRMVDAHGGTVEVRSDGKHRGSDFTVRLPVGGPRGGVAP